MNIAVINLKDIIKYGIYCILTMAIILIGINIIRKGEFESDLAKTEKSAFTKLANSSFLYCLKTELPLISSQDEKQEKDLGKASEKILQSQIALMNNLENMQIYEEDYTEVENEINIEVQEESLVENEITENKITDTEENQHTELPKHIYTVVIDENNINATYNNMIGQVKINNQTSFDINGINRGL